MELELTVGNYGRPSLNLPQTRLVNAYVEETPGGPHQQIRTRRPGLTPAFTLGAGPLLAVFQQPGLFNGDLFSISGGALYRNGSLVGQLAYSEAPQIAASLGQMAIVSGGALYIYDGTSLTPQVFFDDNVSLLPAFSGVSVLYSIFVYPQTGSDQFFFSEAGNAASISAANVSAAQTAPDSIVQSYVLAEEIYFFGQTSVEIWDYNPQVNSAGQVTAPFALSQGRTYARGCAAQASVRKLDNALFWVGDDYTVYRTSQVPTRVSTSFIEDRLKAEGPFIASMTSWTANILGHVFYGINLPGIGESYVYDCQTQEWARWGTLDGSNTDPGLWQGAVVAGQGNQIFVGSYNDNRVFLLDSTNPSDDGSEIQVVVTGAIWIGDGVHKNTNISLHNVRGVATPGTPDPVVEMRYSDDGGRTYTSWLAGSLGWQGSYRYKSTWRALGIVRQPGRIVEFKVSDPVNVTIEGCSANASRV